MALAAPPSTISSVYNTENFQQEAPFLLYQTIPVSCAQYEFTSGYPQSLTLTRDSCPRVLCIRATNQGAIQARVLITLSETFPEGFTFSFTGFSNNSSSSFNTAPFAFIGAQFRATVTPFQSITTQFDMGRSMVTWQYLAGVWSLVNVGILF